MRVRWSSVVLGCAVAAGCSFTQMHTLPEHPTGGMTYECEESRVRPLIDTAVALFSAVATAAVVWATVDCGDGTRERGCSTVGIGYLWVPIAVVYGLSAGHGFAQADRCRAYHENRLPLLPEPTRPAPDPAAIGQPCERIPGVARGGRCSRGLVCRGDVCLP